MRLVLLSRTPRNSQGLEGPRNGVRWLPAAGRVAPYVRLAPRAWARVGPGGGFWVAREGHLGLGARVVGGGSPGDWNGRWEPCPGKIRVPVGVLAWLGVSRTGRGPRMEAGLRDRKTRREENPGGRHTASGGAGLRGAGGLSRRAGRRRALGRHADLGEVAAAHGVSLGTPPRWCAYGKDKHNPLNPKYGPPK